MLDSSLNTTRLVNNSYTDLSSVYDIRSVGMENKDRAFDEISKQFESMMVRMMLKSMRDAGAVFSSDNYLSSHAGDMYQQMYDDQLAVSLSSERGMGIAEIMAKQLKEKFTSNNRVTSAGTDGLSRNLTLKSHVDKPTHTLESNISPNSDNQAETASFDGSIKSFVDQVYPLAEKAARKLGVDAKVLIAQSALETGWGTKISKASNADSSFNLFNIKADIRWGGESVSVPTMEFRDGLPVKENAAFRQYSSLEESFEDYVAFINNSPRYAESVASGNSESYIRGLSEAGYATDPDYAEKIIRIADSDSLNTAINHVTGEFKDHKDKVLTTL